MTITLNCEEGHRKSPGKSPTQTSSFGKGAHGRLPTQGFERLRCTNRGSHETQASGSPSHFSHHSQTCTITIATQSLHCCASTLDLQSVKLCHGLVPSHRSFALLSPALRRRRRGLLQDAPVLVLERSHGTAMHIKNLEGVSAVIAGATTCAITPRLEQLGYFLRLHKHPASHAIQENKPLNSPKQKRRW